jgi:tetratricopeptide (TPR) repeat protein
MSKKLTTLILFILLLSSFCLAAPTKKTENLEALKLNEQGVQAMSLKNFQVAEELFAKAYQLDRDNITIAFNLAGAYITNKKEHAAIPLLTELTKNYSSDVGLFTRLGDAYFSNKQPKEAISSYERGYTIDPRYPALARKLGNLSALLQAVR